MEKTCIAELAWSVEVQAGSESRISGKLKAQSAKPKFKT